MISLLVIVLGGGALLLHFLSLERRGRAASVVGWVWGIVILDAASQPGFERGVGVFHPQVGDISFRLPEVAITAALVARVLARGGPRRVDPAMLLWGAFAVWYCTAGLIGAVGGHKVELVFFEAKVVVYLVGGLVLAAGVPVREHLDYLPRLARRSSVVATLVIVLDQAGVSVTAALPLFPLDRLGEMGGDAASVFVAIGVMTLLVGATQEDGRGEWVVVAAPLVLAPLATDQRAAMLGLALSFAVIAIAWTRPWAHRGMRVTPTELVLVALALVAFVTLPSLGGAVIEQRPTPTPFSDELRVAFEGQAKLQSAESRRNQWAKARTLIAERPLIGHGLGTEYRYYEQGPDEVWQSNLTHNVPFDVLMRSGAIGFGLLLAALAVSLAGGVRVLRRSVDSGVAAMALACTAVVIGLAGKSLVESLFEKYLLATVIGLVLGTLRSCDTAELPPRFGPSSATRERSWS